VWKLRTAESMLDSSVGQRRLTARVLLVFAVAALLLAAVGVYGVTAYTVSGQTHEMAVRLTFGATREAILGLILRRGLRLAALGVGLGLAGALAGGRLIASMLFGVAPTDPLTLSLVALVAVVVDLAACFEPAYRATHVDPKTALTVE